MFNKDELNRLYRYAVSLCHNEELGYDLLQTALEKMFVKSGEIEVQYPIRYAMRAIKNIYLNEIRKSSREEAHEDISEFADESYDLDQIISDKIDTEKVLDLCDEREREVLFLWAFEGMTYEEISKFLEVSKGSLLTKIHNMKKRIQKSFNQGGSDE